MKFGVFDHVDRRARAADETPINVLYEERLKMVAAAEQAGFYAYHVAEAGQMMLGHMVLFLTFIAAMVTNLCDADDTLCDSFGFGSHYAVLLVCSIYGKRCGRRLP